MFNVSALLLDDALPKCVVAEAAIDRNALVNWKETINSTKYTIYAAICIAHLSSFALTQLSGVTFFSKVTKCSGDYGRTMNG